MQVGGVLNQEQNIGPPKMVGNWSQAVKMDGKVYKRIHYEGLTGVCSVWLLQSYPRWAWFRVRTIFNALRWILNMMNATGKPAHWRLSISEFESDLVLRARVERLLTEALQCLKTLETEKY